MARKYKWTPEKYRAALVGNKEAGVEGLRSLVRGFDSKKTRTRDSKGRWSGSTGGYDLRAVEDWTPAQKLRVRDYFARVEQLEAQSKLIVRSRSVAKLETLHVSFHGDVASGAFKVAFVPYHEPKTTLPGAKKRKPSVRVLTEGVSIRTRNYERVFIPFNPKSLVRDTRVEVARAAAKMPGASVYFVQVGDNQTLNGKSLGLITSDILRFMEQYDGKTPLPASSGNRGDNPKHHHWKYWLNGLVGYILPRGADVRTMSKIIRKGRLANEERKRKLRNYMKRKGRK